LTIIAILFPTDIGSMSEFEDLAAYIGGYLFDAGYTPRFDAPCNPTWHWGGSIARVRSDDSEVPSQLVERIDRQEERSRGHATSGSVTTPLLMGAKPPECPAPAREWVLAGGNHGN